MIISQTAETIHLHLETVYRVISFCHFPDDFFRRFHRDGCDDDASAD